MEIDIRNAGIQYKWKEVTVKHDGATIKFDVSDGDETKQLLESLLDAAFGVMDADEIVSYLNERGYSDEVIERNKEQAETAA